MDGLILNSIDQHGLSNKSFKLKPNAVITHIGTIDITTDHEKILSIL